VWRASANARAPACECPQYEDQQNILRKVSRDISLPKILGTKEGIAALAEFLEKSGVFSKTGWLCQPRALPSFEDEPDPEETDDEDSDAEGW
jgi:hypothetical protein